VKSKLRILPLLGAGLVMACSGSSSDDDDDAVAGKSGNAGSGGSAARGGSAGSSRGGSGGSSASAGAAVSGGAAGSSGGTAGQGAASGSGSAGRGGSAGSGGGTGGHGGQGGNAGAAGTTSSAGDGGQSGAGCVPTDGDQSSRKYSHRAASSGFSGSDADYGELYDLPCFSVDDCIAPCSERGGTEAMCAASQCIDSIDDYCLPATIWSGLGALSAEGTDPYSDAAQLVLVNDPYLDQLLLDDFRFEIPEDAEIRGITVTVRRAGGGPNEAVDAAVRLIKGGTIGMADRSSPEPWSAPDFVNVDYGGPNDLWGQTWTAADFNAENFGVALAASYPQTGGNGRGYVDIVYATVHYRQCE
jgi:hypothetical protein